MVSPGIVFQQLLQSVIGIFKHVPTSQKIAPKVFILAMVGKEVENWLSSKSALDFNQKIVLPGLSRGYDKIFFTEDRSVCLLVAGSALINAALSVATVTSSPLFGLSKNYFLLTGIAGVNPKLGTIGAVTFAKFAVQVDTQLEFDGREIPSTWSTGYVPMGADSPESFPRIIHGSEVYELNDDLRQVCISFARTATLEDSAAAAEHRALYAGSPNGIYHAATLDPSIIAGDVASSNVFWHGSLLCEGMEKVFKIYTAGKVEYAMTASEDTAIMTALLRAALQKQVDFSRIILMRGGSNFDRSYSNSIPPSLPYILDQGGLEPAKRNLNLSGLNVVQGILEGWSTTFEHGIEANNYVGDVFGSLGGIPDFLPREKDL